MKLLNLGCGGQRPQSEFWWNLDTLRSQLKDGTPERINLEREERYVDCDVLSGDIPFPPATFDGILCQHVLEHMACHDAAMVLEDCRNVLKPGGVIVCSVPDADYFLSVHDQDNRENAKRLFGEPMIDSVTTFFDYALFFYDHIQILTHSSLRCLLLKAGFQNHNIWLGPKETPAITEIWKYINRLPFSAILCAYK